MCHRCGYVQIPETSKYFNAEYKDIPINCHGGLTYGRGFLSQVEPIDSNTYWIGWNYAHYLDGGDYESGIKYYGNEDNNFAKYMALPEGYIYKDWEVEEDCKSVIDQLIELEK